MKKISVTTLLICYCLMTMVGCGTSSNAPSMNQIKSDLSGVQDVVDGVDDTGKLSIKKIDILLADTEDDIYEADIEISLENDVYAVKRSATVAYKKFDVGGWVLQDTSNVRRQDVDAIGAYPENAARNNAKELGNVSLEDKNINLSKKQCEYTFVSTKKGKFFDYSVKFTDEYTVNEVGVWTKSDRKIVSYDYTLNKIDGLYLFDSSSWEPEGKVIHFNDDNTVTLLFEDSGKVIREQPSFRFDENEQILSMWADNYEFIIRPSEIGYYKNDSLSSINFFDYKWLREKFYDECVSFIREEQKRNQKTYASDLSSTIQMKDLYGEWEYMEGYTTRHRFYISNTGIDHAIVFDEDTSVSNINMPKIDFVFYGYDKNKEAYIVKFCTRIYTTSTYYVDRIHTLEFVKDKNGTISLKNYYSVL